MELNYRLATTDDYDALVRFWCEHSGWDVIDRQVWEERFIHTPHGPSVIALTLDEAAAEILGQFVFVPFAVQVDGRQRKGFRAFAPILRQDVRNAGESHHLEGAVFQMYLQAVTALMEQQADVIFILPDPRWNRLLRKVPFFQTVEFPLYSRPVGMPVSTSSAYRTEPLDFTDARLDDLWLRAQHLYGCMIVRSGRLLAWKNSHRDYQLRGVFAGDELIGAFVYLRSGQNRQWLICDVLAVDAERALPATLRAACATGEQQLARDATDIDKIAILATPLAQPLLGALGFTPAAYNFILVVHPISQELPPEALAPERWYLSAND